MKLGNREKIIIGSIAGIMVIGALHAFIFSPKAKRYSEARLQMEEQRSRSQVIAGNVPGTRLKQFEDTSQTYKRELYNLVNQLNLAIPKQYTEINDEAKEQRREDFIELVKELNSLRQESKVKLTFLDEKGWELPRELPKDVREKRIDLWDLVHKLREKQSIIEEVKDPEIKAKTDEEYKAIFRQLGIMPERFDHYAKLGPPVPLVKLVSHGLLVWQERVPGYKISRDQLFWAFRINLPVDELYYYNKQLRSLIDIIKIGEDSQIEEISYVKLYPKQVLRKESEEAPAEGGQPGPARFFPGEGVYPGAYRDMGMEAPPGAMMPGGEIPPPEVMMELGFAFPGAGGRGMVLATPTPAAEDTLGSIVPIKFRYQANNLNSSKFLYNLTHLPRSYVIDDLAIQSTEEGKVDVFATVESLATVTGLIITEEELNKWAADLGLGLQQ